MILIKVITGMKMELVLQPTRFYIIIIKDENGISITLLFSYYIIIIIIIKDFDPFKGFSFVISDLSSTAEKVFFYY